MNDRNGASPWRCLLVMTAATIALAGLVAGLRPDLAAASLTVGSGRLATTPFADLLEWWCAACALAAGTWLWAGTLLLAATAVRRGPRTGRRQLPTAALPAPVRRIVLLACGVALTGGLAVPAQAATGRRAEPGTASTATRLDGLPLPDRATGRGPRPAVVARPTVSALPAPVHHLAAVVVQPGDTLWDLAQDALPGEADDRAVARRWHRLYAVNRPVVGPDPDLIRPGQRLRLPHP